MAPQRELGVNEILPRRLTQLVKPRSLRGGTGTIGELNQRGATPQFQPRPQQARSPR